MDCPRCEGSGLCAECKGSGSISCLTCQGKGNRVTPRGQSYDCRTCSGTGKVDCSTRCASCEGTGQITSRLQQKMREKYQFRGDDTSPRWRLTQLLAFCTATLWIFQEFGSPAIQKFIGLWLTNSAAGLPHGEVWRLVTPMFLHVGIVHLAANGSYLLSACPQLEGLLGGRRFLALYFLAGVCGNLASWFGHCYLGGMPWAGMGASTSLFGVSAAFMGLHWRWGMFDGAEIRSSGIYLVLFTLGAFVAGDLFPIDQWGHAGGFLGGLAFVLLTRRPSGR